MQVSHADKGRTGLLPAGQAMHSAEPVWLLYLPAAHRAQVPPLGPDEPALHVQSSAELLPDGEFAREGQLEHAVVPSCDAYFPASHWMQSASPSLDVYLPAMHAVHVDEELAEYVPAKQFAHAIAPDSTDTNDDDHDPVKPL